MKLNNEFTVNVPIERVWETLLDIERVAGFLPGATIEAGADADGAYRGAMKVKVGPMVVNYRGTAKLGAVDEQNHTADIEVSAREAKGQGTAAAVIRNTLVPGDGSTRVMAETDLQITGRQAQFGRGIMQDIASRMLGDFAQRFEKALLEEANGSVNGSVDVGESAPATNPDGIAASRATAVDDDDAVLDMGSVLFSTPYIRYGAVAAGGLAVLALGGLALSRRQPRGRGLDVRLNLG
ncbi:MAG TPA: SRPBCC family protein [Conexibacter sp.]|jgi:carbon monoxide dehydrogenase subunit G